MNEEEGVAGINVRELRDEKQMLQGQLDMSRALVAGAKAEIAQLEKQLSLLQHKERMMHEEIDISHRSRQEVQARIQQLEEAWREFGSHNAGCLWEYSRCTCGFAHTVAALFTFASEAPEKEEE